MGIFSTLFVICIKMLNLVFWRITILIVALVSRRKFITLLFSFYLNDLHDYFQKSDLSQGIDCNKHDSDDTVIGFVKLFILLYADDTAIVSESAADLQNALNIYETY